MTQLPHIPNTTGVSKVSNAYPCVTGTIASTVHYPEGKRTQHKDSVMKNQCSGAKSNTHPTPKQLHDTWCSQGQKLADRDCDIKSKLFGNKASIF